MLDVAVQELVHDVHDVCEARDLTDLLEAVLGVLRPLDLLEGDFLEAVPRELLDGVKLPQSACGGVERLIGRIQSDFVTPFLETDAALFRVHLGLECGQHVPVRLLADVALVLDVLLEDVQRLRTRSTCACEALLLRGFSARLRVLPFQVSLHHQQLLLQEFLLFQYPSTHVVVDPVLGRLLMYGFQGVLFLFFQRCSDVLLLRELVRARAVRLVSQADRLPQPRQLCLLFLRLHVHVVVLRPHIRQDASDFLHSALVAGGEGILSALDQPQELVVPRACQRGL
mmetsp:Transcript_127617/g.330817  ORF Transcript_127617/g.330817 Transcript_127617/m.330817 type:complete len:284 (+) Transcript_127617:877-1728(+)